MSTHRADDDSAGVVLDFQARRSTEPEPTVSVNVCGVGLWTVIKVEGEMDIQAVALLAEALKDKPTHVVFGLQGVTFMDACGLGLLLVSRTKALAAGGCVRLAAPSPQALRILTLSGTHRAFTTFHSLLEAVTEPVTEVPNETGGGSERCACSTQTRRAR